MSWSKRVKHPSKILNVGDNVEAMVLGVDPTARRISLGLKQVEQNPWHELAGKYPVGTKHQGQASATSPSSARSSRWRTTSTA
jgi:small subunit ribosomal protein S1